MAKHMSKSKPWHNPPNDPEYYEWLKNKKVNKLLRLIASTGASAVMQVLYGRLKIEVPQATTDYDGRAVFSPAHRSGWDIPATVAAIARAGFERPRPVSKDGNFPNRPVSWLMHNLGAGAVNREHPKISGIESAFGNFLEHDENLKVYSEGTRIKEDARRVRKIAGTALLLAAQHSNTAVIAMGCAGLAQEDSKRPIGFGAPIVITFSEPLHVPLADTHRESLKTASVLRPQLQDMMQAALDRAYELRDAYL